jgi:hypothetical protein
MQMPDLAVAFDSKIRAFFGRLANVPRSGARGIVLDIEAEAPNLFAESPPPRAVNGKYWRGRQKVPNNWRSSLRRVSLFSHRASLPLALRLGKHPQKRRALKLNNNP